jgi:hypothetical protein
MTLTLKLTWRTRKDAEVCPVCKELEGYTWILEAGPDSYPNQFVHPVYGPVYDTRPAAEGSLIKEEKGHVCRCTLKHEFHTSHEPTSEDTLQNE